mmetsp:Transcript_4485/g.6724  ORF Transcript_4485/g.6724 Transcript_4485/m.6724 type:complete len:411 (+) Transcript_4485:159-1391(+)
MTQQVWLWNEHPRHSENSSNEKDDLNSMLSSVDIILPLEFSRTLEHGDEEIEKFWRFKVRMICWRYPVHPVDSPLVNNKETHVAKDAEHKHHLRDKLHHNVVLFLPFFAKEPAIGGTQTNTKHHLRNTDQNGHFHFERVIVEQIVGGNFPGRRYTHRVSAEVFGTSWISMRIFKHVDTKKVQRHSKAFVVQETHVHSKQTHQQEHVASVVTRFDHFVETRLAKRFLLDDKEKRKEQHECSMTEITKHHTKQKGERNDGKRCRIHFLIAGDTIRVYNILERLGKLVGLKIGWRGLSCLDHMEHRLNESTRALGGAGECILNVADVLVRHPTLCNEGGALYIIIKQIHSVVDCLFLEHTYTPRINVGANGVDEHVVGTVLVYIKNAVEILKTVGKVFNALGAHMGLLRARIT